MQQAKAPCGEAVMIDQKELIGELESMTRQLEEHTKLRNEETAVVQQLEGGIKLVRHLLGKSQANLDKAATAEQAPSGGNEDGAAGSP